MAKTENLVEKAKKFATKAHKGQKRKFRDEYYIKHPSIVAFVVEQMGLGKEYVAAAWLHDVVEDCNVSLNKIKNLFGEKIADYVNILTRNKNEDKEEYVKRFVNCEKEVAIIKLADVYHNTIDLSCYSKEKQKRKREFCKKYYLPRAKKDCPKLYELIKMNLKVNPEN